MSLVPNNVWFGTENDMRWVPAPLPNYTPAQVRWRAKDQYLNGGAGVRQSTASHKELSLSWPVQSQEDLAPLVSYLQQAGPYFYLDPLNAEANAVPAYWSMPGLVQDGPPLIPGVEPSYVPTVGGRTLGYPTTSAVYEGNANTRIRIPVPSGYTLHVGLHGSGPGIAVGSSTAPAIPLTSTERTNLQYSSPGVATIQLLPGTHVISGIIAQVLPTGAEVPRGGFIPGMGHSQLVLDGDPTVTHYSVGIANAQTGIAADFVEVGAWL